MLPRARGTSVRVRHVFKVRHFAAALTFLCFAQRQSHTGPIVLEAEAAGSPSDADWSKDSAFAHGRSHLHGGEDTVGIAERLVVLPQLPSALTGAREDRHA